MEAVQQCYKVCDGSNKGVWWKRDSSVTRGVTEVTKECDGSGTAVLQGVWW